MNSLVTQHLPLLADSPKGVQKLRELILELAVRGKLVPQDPNDEPASELLGRIAEEKARLVAEGKIKKQKPLAEVKDEEKPFELPEGWEWATWGYITEWITYGFTRPMLHVESGPKIITAKNVKYGVIDFEDVHFASIDEFANLGDKDKPELGDILLTKDGSIGRAAVVNSTDSFCINQSVAVLWLRHKLLDPHFLVNAIHSPFMQAAIWNAAAGAAIKHISITGFGNFLVPLPPIKEQHRIVAKVDELMALCDRLEARQADAESAHAQLVKTLLDSLTQAQDARDFAAHWQRLSEHFHSLFTTESSIDALKQSLLQLAVMGKLVPQDPNDEPASELLKRIAGEKARLIEQKVMRKGKPLPDIEASEYPFELPSGWGWVRLGQIGDWGAGATPARGNLNYYGGAIPWFKSGELIADFISESEETVTELALQECSLRQNKSGDVLIAMYGATIGKTAILNVAGTTNQAVCACTTFNGVFNRYLLLTLKALKSNFIGQGAGGAQPNISREKIIATVVGLPTFQEQHRIVAKVDQLMALCDQLKAQLSQARQLQTHLANALVEQAVA